MQKKDMLTKQESIWVRDLVDKEIARVAEELTESNGHPLIKIRLENLEAVKIKLNNQILYRPKKRAKTKREDELL